MHDTLVRESHRCRWQVTLCDPIWHVIPHSGVVISIKNCYIRVYFTLVTLLQVTSSI